MQEQAKGFFGSLFDLSFKHFVTLKIIKVLYVAVMAFFGWRVCCWRPPPSRYPRRSQR